MDNPSVSNFVPGWNQKYRTLAEMESDLGIKYEGPGWYVKGKVQALIFEEDGWWYVAMYSCSFNMKEVFAQIAAFPTIKAG